MAWHAELVLAKPATRKTGDLISDTKHISDAEHAQINMVAKHG